MILTCPACSTKYVVKDGAIPAGGRQVRCASCKHSWHQDPEVSAVEADHDDQTTAEAAVIDPRSGPEIEERAYEESVIADEASAMVSDDGDVAASPADVVGDSEPAAPPERDQWADDRPVAGGEGAAALSSEPASESVGGMPPAEAQEFEPFYEPEPVEGSRRKVPGLVWLLLIVVVLAVAGWFLAPESIRERLGLGSIGGSDLEVMVTSNDRQRLASGNQLFAVSGRVINPTDREQKVPPIRAELLDASRKKVVYSWTIAPPASSLDPGDSASFNSAEVDVPEGGVYLRVTLGGSSA